MSLFQLFHRKTILLALLFAPSTFASQFTYHSQDLPFIQGYVAGEPSEDVGNYDPPFPYFSVDFAGAPANQNLQLTASNVSLWWDTPYDGYLWSNSLSDDSYVHFDSNGVADAWHFALELLLQSPGDEVTNPTNDLLKIESSHGGNLADQDTFWAKSDIYIQRQGSWQLVSWLDFEYASPNTADNWAWAPVAVDEPWAIWLMALGVATLSMRRRVTA